MSNKNLIHCQHTAIYCKKCAYELQDSTKNLESLY